MDDLVQFAINLLRLFLLALGMKLLRIVLEFLDLVFQLNNGVLVRLVVVAFLGRVLLRARGMLDRGDLRGCGTVVWSVSVCDRI
ncbi:hypothetical protein DFJ77DRAFT_454392 [Powellomyces hirtus]|nr:hypothetical protein DFJ77DRAFT_454392 [Powellomyces hirtus]